MKKNYFIIALAMILMLLSLTSCSGGIKGDEVKTLTADFFGAVRAEDWASAKTYLHPALDDLDLKTYFLEVEEAYGLDFQEAFKVERYTGFHTSFYSSEVDGSSYTLTMEATAGEKPFLLEITAVRNDAGYGIYYITIAEDK